MPPASSRTIWFACHSDEHCGEILALVGAAAFLARERRRCDSPRREQHVAQVEPFESAKVEGAAVADRPLAERAGHLADGGKSAFELRGGAERADVIRHHGLQRCDHGGRVDGAWPRLGSDEIERALRGLRSECVSRASLCALCRGAIRRGGQTPAPR